MIGTSKMLVSRLAQLVERKTLNLVVVGSSPTVGVLFAFFWPQLFFFFFLRLHSWRTKSPTDQLLWRSWQRVGLIIPRSPVRSWSGAFPPLSLSLAEHALSKRKVASSILAGGSVLV